MQCCEKRGITSRVINPLRVAASQQANIELHVIWASLEVATVAVPIYCNGLLHFTMSDTCYVNKRMKLVSSWFIYSISISIISIRIGAQLISEANFVFALAY